MKQLTLCLLLCLAGPAFAKTLTIAVDASESSGALNPAVAKIAAAQVRREIAALQLGDVVRLQKFGARSVQNLPSETIAITRAMRPATLAERIGKFVEEFPAKVNGGDDETNIIAYLEFGSHFDCANGGKILLVSDGIESSSYISAGKLLAGKSLPPPDSGLLTGCEVEIFGLGQTQGGAVPPQSAKALRSAWESWMKAAGAKFTAVIDP